MSDLDLNIKLNIDSPLYLAVCYFLIKVVIL